MTDLIARLRAADPMQMIGHDGREAAAALEALRAENERLREQMAERVEAAYREGFDDAPSWTTENTPYHEMQTRYWNDSHARATLAGKG